MSIYKNVTSQKLAVLAWDKMAGGPKTGDAANITAQISKDGAVSAASDDTNPTELDSTNHPGVYIFDLTQAETNANLISFTAKSVTANIVLDPRSNLIYTMSVSGGAATEAKQDQIIAAVITNAAGVDIAADIIALKAVADIIATDTTTDIPGLIATAQADLDIITGATGVNLLAATQSSIDAIEADTDELQGDWVNAGRLDAILDIIAADTTTDIPALIATAQADLDIITGATGVNLLAATQASIDAIEADTDEMQTDDIPGLIAALENLSAAEVNAEMVDALATDTYAEPGQGAPGATVSLAAKINYLYKFLRNKVTEDGSAINVYNDAGAVIDQKSDTTEVGGTVTRGKFGTGA